MEFIYVLLALALAVGAYFLFFRKGEPELPPRSEESPPPRPKSERAPAPATRESIRTPPATEPAAKASAEPVAPEAAARPSRPPPPARTRSSAAPPPVTPKPRDVSGLRRGLSKSREAEGFFGRLR